MQPDSDHQNGPQQDAHEGHKLEQGSGRNSSTSQSSPPLFTNTFFSRDPSITAARKLYLKIILAGTLASTFIVFGIFPILYGSFYKTPVRNLPGWVIDFDNGPIGQSVVAGLSAPIPLSLVTWNVRQAAQFPGGVDEVAQQIAEEKTWIAVTVNPGASARLAASLALPNSSYDGSEAISIFAVEARNEGAYDNILIPSAQLGLTTVLTQFTLQTARMTANASNLPQLLSISPQTLVTPIYFQVFNLHPFDQPVANIVINVGLLFVLILSFIVIMFTYAAREKTNVHRLLKFRSFITLRLTTLFTTYFLLSLFDSLLALAFQLDVDRKFGKSGFLVFWMMNFCGMCAMGLAIEAMLCLLGMPGIPFFLLIWLMANVAVMALPIEILPVVYRYGYAMPLYYISKASRTIIFSTKNHVGLCFGIFVAWIVCSCVLITLFSYIRRRRDISATRRAEATNVQGKAED